MAMGGAGRRRATRSTRPARALAYSPRRCNFASGVIVQTSGHQQCLIPSPWVVRDGRLVDVLRWLVSLALVVCGCHSDDEPLLACTQIGCDSGSELDAGAFSDVQLTGARIKVCLNSTCADQVIATVPAPNDVKTLRWNPPSDPRIEITLGRTAPSGLIEVDVTVRSDRPEAFEDGDVYAVSLTDSGGGELAARAWSVKYRTWQPNGPRCEPTCRSSIESSEL